MRIIVTGSRDWPDPIAVHNALDELAAQHQDLTVVHGACPSGADHHAALWAAQHQITAEPHPAGWDICGRNCPRDGGAHRRPRHPSDIHHPGSLPTYCPSAGPRRNWAMTALGADLCLAFLAPGQPNRGTRNCIRACDHAGIPVRRYSQEADHG